DDRPHELILANAFILRLVVSILTAGAAYGVARWVGYDAEKIKLLTVLLAGIVVQSGFSFRCVFQARLAMATAIFVEFLGEVVDLALIGLIILFKGPLLLILAARVLVDGMVYVAFYFLSRPIVRPKFKMDFGLWRELFIQSLPLVMNTAFITIYLKVDQLMLEGLRNVEELGLYAGGVKLVEALNMIPDSLMISLFPVLARFSGKEEEKVTRTYQAAVKYMALVALPIALFVTGVAREIVTIVFGADFHAGAGPLTILIWAAFFVFIGRVTYNVIISENKQGYITVLVGSTALLNLILNFLFIPRWGPNGAAIASLISYAMTFVIAFVLPDLRQYVVDAAKVLWRPMIAAGVGAAYLLWMGLDSWWSALSAPIVFFAAAVLLGTFDRADIDVATMVVEKARRKLFKSEPTSKVPPAP
ncbi:MAG: flippase, partial [Myxococcales bacterium]|nr:flippase [Myxococcales bacterium]